MVNVLMLVDDLALSEVVGCRWEAVKKIMAYSSVGE